jgi:predicted metalloprotease with PDZ domain
MTAIDLGAHAVRSIVGSAFLACLFIVPAAASPPVTLDIDASRASERLIHTHMQIPSRPGTLTLFYPSWIPGEHGSLGRSARIGSLYIKSSGKVLAWRRDLLDANAFRVEIPGGGTSVEIDFDYLLPLSGSFESASSARLLMLRWASVLLYPGGMPVSDISVRASLKLPAGWKFATALQIDALTNGQIRFNAVSFDELVDSPVLAGLYFKRVDLGSFDDRRVEIDMAGDSASSLAMPDTMATRYKALAEQAHALFGTEHYRAYHFLLALSDFIGHGGLEHHESSDIGLPENFFRDDQTMVAAAYLPPHEYAHSWNGKYRRPVDLTTRNYQTPVLTDLLWIYEGLTSYLQVILTARSGFWDEEMVKEYWAATAAQLDAQSGRRWRPLQDSADALPATMTSMQSSPPEWPSWLRTMDYYDEGGLIWLEVDGLIRRNTQGSRSLDDFVKRFFGDSAGTGRVSTYTFQDVVTSLNAVCPYSWTAFFGDRLALLSAHAPLNGLELKGWHLVFTPEANKYMEASDHRRSVMNATFTFGMTLSAEGVVSDVTERSAADTAGLFPGVKLVEINGRAWSTERMGLAIAESSHSTGSVTVVGDYDGFRRAYELTYRDGPRFPHLHPIEGSSDSLIESLAPRPANAKNDVRGSVIR